MGCEASLTYYVNLFFEFGVVYLPDYIASSPSRVPDNIGNAFEGLLMLKLNLIAHAELLQVSRCVERLKV